MKMSLTGWQQATRDVNDNIDTTFLGIIMATHYNVDVMLLFLSFSFDSDLALRRVSE